MPNATSNPPSVSVVIPTYNGQQLLEKNLDSVIEVMRPGDELIIADDRSTDNSIAWCINKFGLKNVDDNAVLLADNLGDAVVWSGSYPKNSSTIKVTLLQNQRNFRFAMNVNRAVSLAAAEYILLLNSDVRPLPSLLPKLLFHFSDDTVFAVGCLEQEADSQPGGKNKLWFSRGLFMHSRADNFSTGQTAWVSGGSGLFNREKWQLLGGFSSAYYPAYWEDIDLSFRAQKKGWKTLFESEAIVEHVHETTNSSVFGQEKIDAMSWKHSQVFVVKNGTILQKLLHVLWKPYWWWQRNK